MRLWRAHGLGNDYLVLEEGPALTPALARSLCDRHRGAGGDGVLEPIAPPPGVDLGVRIWNPDGSLAEKSGNGLRIFARWAHDRRGAPGTFTVWTGYDVVGCTVRAGDVAVRMGRASFEAAEVPVRDALVDVPIEVGGERLVVTAVGVGNPHCVHFTDQPLDSLPWRRWGRALEVDPRFPNRTNVQIARVIDRNTVAIRIWERGVGETLASGSSSCAVAAAGVHTGRLEAGRIEVRMPGGTLFVTVGEGLDLLLEGEVEGIGTIELEPRWVKARLPSDDPPRM